MALIPQKLLVPLDLGTLEIRNASIQNLSSDPSGASALGQIYFNTATGKLMVCTTAGSPGTFTTLSTGSTPNAGPSQLGLIQLAGDLGGASTSATAPVLAATNSSLVTLQGVTTINTNANISIGGIFSGNAVMGVSLVPTVTGSGSAALPTGLSFAPTVVAGGTGTPVLTGIKVAPALTTTGFNSLSPVGVNYAPVLTLAATTGHTVTMLNVASHSGTATAGATITAFTSLNVAAQTGITNVVYSGNAYGLVVNAPGLSGATNYAARFVGNTQFTGAVDATGQTITATTFAGALSGNATTATDLAAGAHLTPAKGGTGTDTSAVADGQILVGTASTHTWSAATLGGQSGGITVAAGAGSLSVSLAASNSVITIASALATINPVSTLSVGGVLAAANGPVGVQSVASVTGNGSTPIVVGDLVNPTMAVATAGALIAALKTSGTLTLANSLTTNEYAGVKIGNTTINTATAGVLTNFYGLYVPSQTVSGISGVTVTNAYGALFQAPSGAATSNFPLAAASSAGTVNWSVAGTGATVQAGSLTVGSTTVLNSAGILQSAAMPAFTGDVSNTGLAMTVLGATGTFYVGGSSGPLVRNNAGVIETRNNANNAYADFAAGNTTVNGKLTVTGEFVTASSTTIAVGDVMVTMNNDATSYTAPSAQAATLALGYSSGSFSAGGGLVVKRYNSGTTRQDVGFVWDEATTTFKQTVVSGATTQNLRSASVYAADCAAATTTTVTHNLNSTDIHVSVVDKTNHNIVYADCQLTDANTVTVNFSVAPTAGQYRIICIG